MNFNYLKTKMIDPTIVASLGDALGPGYESLFSSAPPVAEMAAQAVQSISAGKKKRKSPKRKSKRSKRRSKKVKGGRRIRGGSCSTGMGSMSMRRRGVY